MLDDFASVVDDQSVTYANMYQRATDDAAAHKYTQLR